MRVKDMKPGDIFRCAYGHPDNIITGVFDKARPFGRCTKIYFNGNETMYDTANYDKAELEVIGHADNYKN